MQVTRKKLRAIGLVFILLVVSAIGYGIYLQTTRAGKIAVTVMTTPRDAQVHIDGREVALGTIYLEPDRTYTVTFHKEGFQDATLQKHISSSDNSILQNLVPVSDEATKWAEENPEDYRKVEEEGGRSANQKGLTFREKNPIVESLPYENFIYSIGYYADTSDPSGNSIIISIDAPEGTRNAAVQQITDLGYDPTDYKIEFNDYRNPFAL